jgi:hypothetical protein
MTFRAQQEVPVYLKLKMNGSSNAEYHVDIETNQDRGGVERLSSGVISTYNLTLLSYASIVSFTAMPVDSTSSTSPSLTITLAYDEKFTKLIEAQSNNSPPGNPATINGLTAQKTYDGDFDVHLYDHVGM